MTDCRSRAERGVHDGGPRSGLWLVGVMHRYSNHPELVESLRKLTALPQRRATKAPPKAARRLIRHPTSTEVCTIIAAYEAGDTIRKIGNQLGFHRERALWDGLA